MCDPLIEGRSRPGAFGTVSTIEVFDEFSKHSATLDGVGDNGGYGGQVSRHAMLEMKDEVWFVLQIAEASPSYAGSEFRSSKWSLRIGRSRFRFVEAISNVSWWS